MKKFTLPYPAPRPGTIITTLDALDALPVGARIADKHADIWDRQNADGGGTDWIDADTIAVVGAEWLLDRGPLIFIADTTKPTDDDDDGMERA